MQDLNITSISSQEKFVEKKVEDNDSTRIFSDEVMTVIFSFLKINQLLNCTLVSKRWKKLGEENCHWKNKAYLLGLDTAAEMKKSISLTVAKLSSILIESDPYLSKEVMTAHESSCLFFALQDRDQFNFNGKMITMHDYHVLDTQQLECENKLIAGFTACLYLNRINRSTWKKVQEYATVLNEKFKLTKYLKMLSFDAIQRNEMEDAEKIFDMLENEYDKNEILNLIIQKKCSLKELDQAFEFFKKLTLNNNDCYEHESSLKNILYYSRKIKRFDIQENLIEIVEEDTKLDILIPLLEELLDNKNLKKINELIFYHAERLNQFTDSSHCYKLIPINIQMGYIRSACELALKFKDSDEFILHFLQRHLENFVLDEEDKIIKEASDLMKNLKPYQP
jgi:hypothetical protein